MSFGARVSSNFEVVDVHELEVSNKYVLEMIGDSFLTYLESFAVPEQLVLGVH